MEFVIKKIVYKLTLNNKFDIIILGLKKRFLSHSIIWRFKWNKDTI